MTESARRSGSPAPLYRPPAPHPTTPRRALFRAMCSAERDLLSLLPADAYETLVSPLGVSRRRILLVNDPGVVRDVLGGRVEEFPKNDLMVGALEPLVGDGLLSSDGIAWQRQRQMVDPAFEHMRLTRAFAQMRIAVDAQLDTLVKLAQAGETVVLDASLSRMTADVMCRTIFSTPLEGAVASSVFDAFRRFQHAAANLNLRQLILGRPFARVAPSPGVVTACAEIRGWLGARIDERLEASGARPGIGFVDIAADVMAARDSAGKPFTRDELIDQLGVFFLAGHETTASSLTWAVFILSQVPEAAARLRAEVDAVAGDGPIAFEHIRQLRYTRSVFRETLRLYPPVTFLPRVARADCDIAGHRVPRGAMVMVSPWVLHRNHHHWPAADRFDPDRAFPAGAYLPFGSGPRVCTGAHFATTEAVLVLAMLLRALDVTPLRPAQVRPIARMTTRPSVPIDVRLAPRTPVSACSR